MSEVTVIAGIPIPSASPVFLSIVGFHVAAGLASVATGIIAMLSQKGRGQHANFGTIYFCCLSAVFVPMTALAAVRWAEDYYLFILGAGSMAAALAGRLAVRRRWRRRLRLHAIGMGISYMLLLTAFYVDNGDSLPLWKELPGWAFWVLPSAAGLPILVYVLLRHPLIRASRASGSAV